MSIYDNISEICKARKMPICELEKRAGLGNGVVGRWRESTPNYKSLKAVADALKVSITKLTKEAV